MRAAKLTVAVLIAMPMGALAQNPSPLHPSTQEQSTHDQSMHEQPSHEQSMQSKLEEGQTSSSCISNITFSQDFLSRYPNAGAACREVKVENGHKWARFDADVVRVRRNRVTVNFVDRFDKKVSTITFDAARDARVDVNGRQKRFSTLKPGDKMSVWMPEERVGFYAEPGASETTKLAVVERTAVER